jgi:hypothetical protein
LNVNLGDFLNGDSSLIEDVPNNVPANEQTLSIFRLDPNDVVIDLRLGAIAFCGQESDGIKRSVEGYNGNRDGDLQ